MSPDILGPHSGLVVGARALLKPRERRDQKLFLVEGPQAVREALDAGFVQTLLIDHTRESVITEFGDIADAYVSPKAMDSLTETEAPQGVVAICAMPTRTLDDVVAERPTLLAVCAGISDPGNLGTIIRTADAAGADAVLVTAGSADAYNGKVIRSTAGSIFHIPVLQQLEPETLVDSLRIAGVHSFGLAGGASTSLFEMDEELLRQPTAWWLGSEAHGLPLSLLSQVQPVSIPMQGSAESLNVATAAGIALFTSARSRRF